MPISVKISLLSLVFTAFLVGSLVPVTEAEWVAYNDCIRQTGDSTAANVTDWTIYDGYTDNNTGILLDFATGSDVGMPTVTFTMNWQNVGSAPCYRPYPVAYRLSNEQGYAKTLVGTVTADQWMPGSVSLFTEEFLKEPPDLPPGPIVETADSVTLPDDIPPGEYHLAIGIVGEQTAEPVVKLAIEGRDKDGWYPLGTLTIAE